MKIAPKNTYIHGRLEAGLVAEIEDGRISELRRVREGESFDAHPFLLSAACVDLQVNGGGGVLLNTAPNREGVAAILNAHRKLGTGWILPTVITDTPDIIDAAADAVIAAKDMRGILGIHIEGPHINPKRKGTHDPARIRPLDAATQSTIKRLRDADIPVMLTLAPEMCNLEDMKTLAEQGVVVSAGHSAANYQEAELGLANGVRAFTHLYNAMPQMSSRDPGIIAAAIHSDAYCGMIADGIHVDWPMLKLAINGRPQPARNFIVSDAMPTVGGPDEFQLFSHKIRVENGRLVNSEGSLAGAHIDMLSSLRNLVQHVGVPLQEALAMAISVPFSVMRVSEPELVGLRRDEWLVLDENLRKVAL